MKVKFYFIGIYEANDYLFSYRKQTVYSNANFK